jgi:hypothetical protein
MAEITGTLLIADWAEVINGKVYAQGLGWSNTVAGRPMGLAMVCFMRVPFDQTNKKHSAHFQLLTADGKPYPSDQPVRVDYQFSIGRLPDMNPNDFNNSPFVVNIQGIVFEPGRYRSEIWLNDKQIDTVQLVAR